MNMCVSACLSGAFGQVIEQREKRRQELEESVNTIQKTEEPLWQVRAGRGRYTGLKVMRHETSTWSHGTGVRALQGGMVVD